MKKIYFLSNHWPGGIAPRVWATQIVALPTREQRREKLAQVPEGIRELVKDHVVSTLGKLAAQRRQREQMARACTT